MACLTYDPGLIKFHGEKLTKDAVFSKRSRLLNRVLESQKILGCMPFLTYPDQSEITRRKNAMLDTLGTLPDAAAAENMINLDLPLTPAKKPTPPLV